MKVLSNGNLLIVGSDGHGMAYGLMELSRMIGVSPWEWWADATPKKRAFLNFLRDIQIYNPPLWNIVVSSSMMKTGD